MEKEWSTFGEEIVHYSKNCDFSSNKDFGKIKDIDIMVQCIESCREISDCTHFTYDSTEKVCSLKKAQKIKQLFAH